MFLLELFDNNKPSLKTELRNAILDVLTPLSSHGATEVTIVSVIDRLKNLDLGIEITPKIIHDCIDPNSVSFVSNVSDDTIYLNGAGPDPDASEMMGDAPEPADPIGDAAKQKASAGLDPTNKPNLTPKF
jgi:hypothetical protein